MILNKKSVCRLICTCLCFVMAANVYGQNGVIPPELYKASGIPDSLKEDANSIVRYSMDEVSVKGPSVITIKHHSLVTILNDKGDREAIVEWGYNKKFDTYSSISIHVYNSDGKEIKKYHKSDMYDGLASSAETLVSDDRFLALKHTISSYPETIEVEYEQDMTSAINLGNWLIQDPEQAVQNSYYSISIDSAAGFRYLNRNTNIKPLMTKMPDRQVNYTWRASNLKAIKLEEGAISWRVLPKIMFVANKFQYYSLPGDISTWKNYGKWQQGLNSDVNTLSPARIAEIKKMTDTIKSDKEKAKFLYKYLQENMRYVSIQLGIGGLKPFPATFVDAKKYGDCKALANYMCALLKAVDIPAYYAKVRAGANEEPCDPSFPDNMSNHIIVCIPFKNDTTWLECTSSHSAFGKLGSFTENRNALIITEDGGKLINTPKSNAADNQFNSEMHITLNADGSAKANLKILSTGEFRFEYAELAANKIDEQKEYLIRDLDLKQPTVFEFKDAPDKNDTKEININLEYDKLYDVAAGDKQFYRSSVFKLWDATVPILEKRKTDFYWEYPREKSCLTTIDLPAGFEVETLPSNTSLKFTYGNYEINYVYNKDKNQVVSTAKFVLTNQVIPAAKYTEMQQYMDGIAKAQNKKLVIKKKA